MQLDSRKVLITGGGSGLGLACAEAVTRAGGTAVVLDRDISAAAAYRAHEVDVTDRVALERVITDVAEDLGGLDAIVTAAGLDTPGELDEVSAEQWENVLAVNLLGTVSAVRAALPYLKESRGRVVTVSSTLALKGAIGVTNLIPGGMKTKFFDGRTEQYMPKDDSRLNEPARVAETVVYALSQPRNVEIREMLIANELEDSWP